MNTKQFNYQNRPQWQIDLINKYPLIYRIPNLILKDYFNEETYQKLINDPYFCNLRFGFECDEGWAELIGKYSNAAFEVLHILDRLYPGTFDSGKYYIRAFIIKEKFGGIRFQNNVFIPYPFEQLFAAFTRELEGQSFIICELTGEFGSLCEKDGVYKTLSPAKAKELGYTELYKK